MSCIATIFTIFKFWCIRTTAVLCLILSLNYKNKDQEINKVVVFRQQHFMVKKSVKLNCAEVDGTGNELSYRPSVPLNTIVLAALLLYYNLLNSLHVHVSSLKKAFTSEQFAQNIIQLVSAMCFLPFTFKGQFTSIGGASVMML